jgi:hypothetical protein
MKVGRYLLLVGSVGALLVGATGSRLVAAASSSAPAEDQPPTAMLQFDTMFANMPPFIGAAGAVRKVTAAPLPWMIRSVHGSLRANGELNIDVDGLVLADEPPVPPSLQGTNPVPFFAGLVSCRTGSGGSVVTTNVKTANFPATMPGGKAHIRQTLTLPHPCVAPVIFVTSPGPGGVVWFAVSSG